MLMKRSSAIALMRTAVFADHLEPVANDVQDDEESEEAPQRLVLQCQHDQQHGRRHAAAKRQGRDEHESRTRMAVSIQQQRLEHAPFQKAAAVSANTGALEAQSRTQIGELSSANAVEAGQHEQLATRHAASGLN